MSDKKNPYLSQETAFDSNVYDLNLEKMVMLFSIEDVKDIVFELRKKLEIPQFGFLTDDEVNSWRKDCTTEQRLLLRKESAEKIFNRCKAMKNDRRFIENISFFILTGKKTAPASNFTIVRARDIDLDVETFYINVYSKLTTKEKDMAFKQLEFMMRNDAPTRAQGRQKKEDIEEDIRLLEEVEEKVGKVCKNEYSLETEKQGWRDVVISFENDVTEKEMPALIEKYRKKAQRARKNFAELIGWDIDLEK